MADVYNYIDPTGLIEVDAGVIQTDVVAEYQAAFGQDLVVPDATNLQGASTPQGILINAEALARIAVADNNASLANQINPNVAGGIFLDAIMALTGSARNPATPTTVFATLSGTLGTVIPAGSHASETGSGFNYVYQTIVDVVIDTVVGDNVFAYNVQFNSVLTGAIPCNVNTLTTIISNVLGWNSITANTAPDPIGAPTQSDAGARNTRLVQLGIQGSSVAGAIIGGVSAVIGTNGSIKFLENTSGATLTINGVSMVGHSIYACVYSTIPGINGTQSTLEATLSGTPTTSIPAGSLVSETASGFNNVFKLVTTVVIGGGGTVTGNFISVSNGAVPAATNSLTNIITPVVNWAGVTNPRDTTLGNPSVIAQALVSKKSAGSAYNNGPGTNISALVIVPYSLQQMTVLYDTPTAIPIYVIVTIKQITPVLNPAQAAQDAIVAYANGQITGEPGLVVGQNVSSFELAGAITTQYPGLYVQNCLIGTTSTPTSPDEIEIEVYQIATISAVNITVNFA